MQDTKIVRRKANGNKPTALQQKNLNDITERGGLALVIDENNIDMLECYIMSTKK